jgi:hypothetical protein
MAPLECVYYRGDSAMSYSRLHDIWLLEEHVRSYAALFELGRQRIAEREARKRKMRLKNTPRREHVRARKLRLELWWVFIWSVLTVSSFFGLIYITLPDTPDWADGLGACVIVLTVAVRFDRNVERILRRAGMFHYRT